MTARGYQPDPIRCTPPGLPPTPWTGVEIAAATLIVAVCIIMAIAYFTGAWS